MQYVVRKDEDPLSGALVSTTCRNSACVEEYATGVLWSKKYYKVQARRACGFMLYSGWSVVWTTALLRRVLSVREEPVISGQVASEVENDKKKWVGLESDC